jgi:AcrR family transcriptional regulator
MTDINPNKHELKTRETRALLLKAAKTIFARDGYEGAELGEIASLAGRTKGAIYAQFKSKEDIFLALMRDQRSRYEARMEQMLAASTDVDKNKRAFRKFYMELVEDPTWGQLLLEFKLFSLRHPMAKKKLQALFADTFTRDSEKRYSAILGAAGKGKGDISRVVAIQTLLPMLSALILEANVSDPVLAHSVVQKVAGRLFDALI